MKVLISRDQISARIVEMGRADHRRTTRAGAAPGRVLKGACPFMTDLSRSIDLP